MKIVYFTHSLISCWNQGNAHFQRGVLRALRAAGHDAIAYEPVTSWSREHLAVEDGPDPEEAFRTLFPDLVARTFDGAAALEEAVEGAGLVIVHEWNDPEMVASLGRLRRHSGFTLLFHDTHHRAVSDPDAIRRFDLSQYDGVLAFGETLAEVYRRWGWGKRVFVWHEAADTSLFRPPAGSNVREGAVWIGNWGDGERSAELESMLLRPARDAAIPLDIFGVRYPGEALNMLRMYGARYHGWLANALVPATFAQYAMTVHVPRRFYVGMLPGIPTIRVFEALACGIPLVSAPWEDVEHLFIPGVDFLFARSEDEMRRHMKALVMDDALAKSLADHGLARIEQRHSCAIRARELLSIVASLNMVPA